MKNEKFEKKIIKKFEKTIKNKKLHNFTFSEKKLDDSNVKKITFNSKKRINKAHKNIYDKKYTNLQNHNIYNDKKVFLNKTNYTINNNKNYSIINNSKRKTSKIIKTQYNFRKNKSYNLSKYSKKYSVIYNKKTFNLNNSKFNSNNFKNKTNTNKVILFKNNSYIWNKKNDNISKYVIAFKQIKNLNTIHIKHKYNKISVNHNQKSIKNVKDSLDTFNYIHIKNNNRKIIHKVERHTNSIKSNINNNRINIKKNNENIKTTKKNISRSILKDILQKKIVDNFKSDELHDSFSNAIITLPQKVRITKKRLKVAKFITKKFVGIPRTVFNLTKNIVVSATSSKFGIFLSILLLLVVILTGGISVGGGGTASYAYGYMMLAKEDLVKEYINKIDELEEDFNKKIEAEEFKDSFDDVVKKIHPKNARISYVEILAILTVKVDNKFIEDHATEKNLEYIEFLYNSMKRYDTTTEEFIKGYEYYTDENGEEHQRAIIGKRLIIDIYIDNYADIENNLGFNDKEKEFVGRLLSSPDFLPDSFKHFLKGYSEIKPLNEEEIKQIIKDLPKVEGARKRIVENAYKFLNQNIQYSMDYRGQYKNGIYYMDCSYFVQKVYLDTFGIDIGSTTVEQFPNSYPISFKDLKPGDLAFKNTGVAGANDHVGIFVNFDSNGVPIFIHCNFSNNGISVDNARGAFKYFRRPYSINLGD